MTLIIWKKEDVIREIPKNIYFPENLPVTEKHDEIIKVIRQNQVSIICGETGSGKTTQLPKICLELGLGSQNQIGHTQPRRIAARSVATRIAEEMNPVIFVFLYLDNDI